MSVRRIHRHLRIEELEPRIAPTGIWDYWVEMGPHSASNGGISNNTGNSSAADIATDTAGNPVVAWSDDQSGDTEIYVLRWDGGAWAALGGSTSGGGISNAPDVSTSPAVAVGTDGNPIVAWWQYSGVSQNVYVRRWDGSSWAEMGAGSASGFGLSNGSGTNQGKSPDIVAATNGNALVVWRQYVSASANFEIYARMWNGASWVELGGSGSGGGVSKLTGESSAPCVGMSSDGQPIIAWQDEFSGNKEIYVRQWNGSSWAEMGAGSASGGGISNNSGYSGGPSITVGADGRAVVSWVDDTNGNNEIYVRRWTGATWEELGGSATGGGVSKTALNSNSSSITIGADGNPVVAWDEYPSVSHDIYVRHWNGVSWEEMGSGSASGWGISNNVSGSYAPAIARGSDGNPIVAWADLGGGNSDIYVRRYTPPPVVNISATDPNASETGADPGVFTVTRVGDTSQALVVGYTIGGTATNGTDYSPLSGAVTIGAGSASATITIVPIDDALFEGPETAILTLSTGGAYVVGTAGSATVRIWDDEPTAQYWVEMGVGSAWGGGISSSPKDSWSPVVAVGTDGNPIVAWGDWSDNTDSEVYVRRWDGSSWVEMGAGSASGGGISNNAGYSNLTAIAVGNDGNPVVAWSDNSDGDYEIYVLRWNGSSWMELGGSASGGGVSNSPDNSVWPSIAVGTDGNPIVAWNEPVSGDNDIFLLRWNGSSWVGLGGSGSGGVSDNSSDSEKPQVVIGVDGNPIVAWKDWDLVGGDAEIYVRRWDGSSWVEMGVGSASGGGISNNAGDSYTPWIDLGADGNPIVAWEDNTGGNYEIYVRRWDGSSWVEVGVGSASGGGVSNNTGNSSYATVCVGGDGSPIVSWFDRSNSPTREEIYVRRWDGLSWVEMGEDSASGGGISKSTTGRGQVPRMAIGGNGSPIVVWEDYVAPSGEIFVRRYAPALAGPEVTITATDRKASEPGADTGTFTVIRSGSSAHALRVSYTVGGTATNGGDYETLSGFVTIPAGATSAMISVTPLDDSTVELRESVLATLKEVRFYTIGSAGSATIGISDDDGQRIPLDPGKPKMFTDGDGTGVTILVTGACTSGYFTLVGGVANGASIADIVLEGTSDKTSLSIKCKEQKGFSTPGTSFDSLLIEKLPTAGNALGTLAFAGISLAPHGWADVDGGVKSMTLGAIGEYADVEIRGPVPTFTGTGIGTGAVLSMGGNVGTLKVSSVGTGARIVVGGDLKTVNVLAGNMDGAILSDGTVGIGTISIPKGGMNPGGTIGAAKGGIKTLTVGGGNLTGLVQAGGAAGIGTISIPKGGFNGTLTTDEGGLKSLTVGGTSGNLAGTIEIGGSAGIGTITVSKGSVVGATISATHTSGAGVKSVTVGGGSFTGQILSAGTGGIGTVSVPKGGFTGSLIATAGGVKSVTIGGSAGHFAGQIVADGSAGLGTITLNGSATGTISAGHAKGGIKSLTVNGGITNGTVISQGTGGVGTMTVKGNADVDLTVPQGQVGSFTLTGTTASKLSGTWKILGIKTFKGTLGELSDFVLTAGTAIGSFTASGSMTGHSSLMAASVGTISIQGNLMSDEKYAILVNGNLGKTSKVDIGGTATYGAGAGGAGTNRIKIDGELDGLITVGSKITDGMFGDVVVTNALGGSTGKLVADQRNNTALFYYPNTQGAILFTCGKTTGDGCALLFNSWAWPET